MEGLRLQTPEEAATAVEELFGAVAGHPSPAKHRWHCGECGRWVRFATVRKVPPRGPDWYDEHDYTGECKTHGEVSVTWPET